MAATVPFSTRSVITEEPTTKLEVPKKVIVDFASFWQSWAIAAAESLVAYCGLSIGILFLITLLILTGTALEGEGKGNSNSDEYKSPYSWHNGHLHTNEFYSFVMTVLVSIRAGLYYMARALKRAAIERDSRAIGIWLFVSFLIMVGEGFLGVALLKCLPGVLSVILLFLFVELIAQATFIWIVWNFKLELNIAAEFEIPPDNSNQHSNLETV